MYVIVLIIIYGFVSACIRALRCSRSARAESCGDFSVVFFSIFLYNRDLPFRVRFFRRVTFAFASLSLISGTRLRSLGLARRRSPVSSRGQFPCSSRGHESAVHTPHVITVSYLYLALFFWFFFLA